MTYHEQIFPDYENHYQKPLPPDLGPESSLATKITRQVAGLDPQKILETLDELRKLFGLGIAGTLRNPLRNFRGFSAGFIDEPQLQNPNPDQNQQQNLQGEWSFGHNGFPYSNTFVTTNLTDNQIVMSDAGTASE